MTFAGFVIYSRSRGLDKLSIIIGLLFYFIGSLAMVAWSIALIGRQKLYKVVATSGVIVGLVVALSIVFGWIHLIFAGMTAIVIA